MSRSFCACICVLYLYAQRALKAAAIGNFARDLGNRTYLGPPVSLALSQLGSPKSNVCQSLIVFTDGAARDQKASGEQFVKARLQGVRTMMVMIGAMAVSMMIACWIYR